MKFLPILLFLLVLVSCGKSTTEKSQECSINGSPVECSSINSQSTKFSKVLKISIKSKVMVFDDFIEIKSRATDFMSETVNNKTVFCEVSTADIMGLFYRFNEESLGLKVKKDGEEEIYKRVSGEKDSLNGEWISSVDLEDHVRITKLKFEDDQIEITTECKF
jgi:hypothetical protein